MILELMHELWAVQLLLSLTILESTQFYSRHFFLSVAAESALTLAALSLYGTACVWCA